jgi:hypothetical protein
MDPAALLIGFLLGKSRTNQTRTPDGLLPGPGPSPVPPPGPGPAPGPAPAPVPPPGPAPAPAPFPNEVPDVVKPAAPGMLRAVEIWRPRPDAAQASANVVGDAAVDFLKSQFPRGWHAPNGAVTAAERARAVALLGQWVNGRVIFEGPETLQGIRAFVMTQHPRTVAPSPAPAPAPPAPSPVVPPAPTPSGLQETTVRPREGLAQVAKRLGQPENAKSAGAMRRVNVPVSADGKARKSALLAAGGLDPVINPGDRLFVPPEFGIIDPARL